MPRSIELLRRIRWADADAAQRIHFPKIFEYVEEAETELWRESGLSIGPDGLNFDLPRKHAESTFHKILALDAPFRLVLTVANIGRSSIRYDFHAFNETGELAAEGSMTVVAIRDGKPVEVPREVRVAFGISEA